VSTRSRFEVGPADAGARLDQFLVQREKDLSRARLQQLIEQGHVTVDGRAAAKSGVRLKAGQTVALEVPAPEPVALVPQAMGLRVLFEDAALVVIDKPAGIAVHPGAGVRSATLVHGLLHQIEGLAGIGGELRPGIVHRLDKDTSGCLVVAKSEVALRALQAAFKARTVEKVYLALVHGAPPEAGTFDTFHGRHPTDRKRFSTKLAEGRRAVTKWRVLARSGPEVAKPGGGAQVTLVSIELMTGRTHQIRAHFADAGFPLVADSLYGATRREAKLPDGSPIKQAAAALGRQWLHAKRLAFDHPLAEGRRPAPAADHQPVPAQAAGSRKRAERRAAASAQAIHPVARVSCAAPLPEDLRRALSAVGLEDPDGG
jgi:23S rRNA pseudouridine1911/1915/1917 synthase